MTLQFVDPLTPTTHDVLLYGPPKVGKTVGALSAPGPILYLNAEGTEAAAKARQLHPDTEVREVVFVDKRTLDEVYRYLLEPSNGIRTFVLDSVGEVYRKLIDQIGGDRPQIQHWGDVNKIIERFVRAVRDLPVNVVLVCHEQIDDDAEAGRIVRPQTGGQALPQKLMAMVSTIAYCGVVPATDDSPRRYVAQLVETKGRRAGSRWQEELGEYADLDLSAWITIIAASTAVKAERAPEGEDAPDESDDAEADEQPELEAA